MRRPVPIFSGAESRKSRASASWPAFRRRLTSSFAAPSCPAPIDADTTRTRCRTGADSTLRGCMVVVFSLAGAFCYALASVLQHRAASVQPAEHSMRLALLVGLVQRPLWLAGITADV